MSTSSRKCRHCGEVFNTGSQHKRRVGGYIDECPWCVEERGGDDSPPKYLAISAGNGKMSDITLLKFNSPEDRARFKRNWDTNSGRNRGKSCQLNRNTGGTGGIRFSIVAENRANDNHKGKS